MELAAAVEKQPTGTNGEKFQPLKRRRCGGGRYGDDDAMQAERNKGRLRRLEESMRECSRASVGDDAVASVVMRNSSSSEEQDGKTIHHRRPVEWSIPTMETD